MYHHLHMSLKFLILMTTGDRAETQMPAILQFLPDVLIYLVHRYLLQNLTALVKIQNLRISSNHNT